MKVALDISRMHPLSRSRGIGIYAKNLYQALKKYTNLDIELIEEKVDYKKFDLIHFPYFDLFTHTLPLKLPKLTVVTIHDLIPLQFPQNYPPGIKGKINWQLQKLALKNVKSIISVSEIVKKDIEEILKIEGEKIKVVYSAPSTKFKKATDQSLTFKTRTKYQLPDEFVLFVGNVNWNKNILNTAQACIDASKNLVIVGGAFLDKTGLNHPEKESFKQFLERFSNNDLIKILGYVPTEDLNLIMSLAKCMLFVSKYEGFGLPILEAQATKLPVITSNLSATPEIAGEGALLVNPDNTKQISEAIQKIFSSEELRNELIKKGGNNLKRFSWEKTALQTVKIYQNALD